MASFQFASQLKAVVNDAQDVLDMISLFKHVSLDEVKQLINQHIDAHQADHHRSMYCKSFAADRIMSSDVLQTVLSFCPERNNMKSVNKAFNEAVGTDIRSDDDFFVVPDIPKMPEIDVSANQEELSQLTQKVEEEHEECCIVHSYSTFEEEPMVMDREDDVDGDADVGVGVERGTRAKRVCGCRRSQ